MELENTVSELENTVTNLRLLKIGNVQLPEGLEYLSNKLRLLDWHRYPLQSLPSNLQLDKTVELKMCYSRIKELWKGIKPLNMLKVMKLRHSENLIKTPDFTEAPNLEELDLEGCTRLRKIHPSLLLHKKLILLNLKGCKSLTTLPGKIFMKSLKTLVLSGCLKLRNFPHVAGSMECLRELLLDETDIKEMPLSIELLSGLVQLTLKGCKNLVRLPSNINSLKSLKTLNLSGCFKLENLLETVGQVESLEELDISGTAIRCPPSSIFLMKNLKALSFRGCSGPPSSASCYLPFPINLMRRSSDLGALMLPSLSGLGSLTELDLSDRGLGEGAIPSDIGNLHSLKKLYLSKNNFVTLPASINCLFNLEKLELEDCKRLQSLPQLPPNVNKVEVNGCASLVTLLGALKLELSGCSKLKKFPQIVESMEDLSKLYLDGTSIAKVPSSIELLAGLELLNLNDCKNLVRLPSGINSLKSLKTLNLSGCCKLENLPDTLGKVESLEELDVSGTAIRRLPSSIFLMKNLKTLSFSRCNGLLASAYLPFNLLGKSSRPVALMLPSLTGACSLTKLDLSDCGLGEGAIPSDIGNLHSLKKLYLSRNNFVTLPASISGLLDLEKLELEDCKRLQSLPQLPPNVNKVEVNGCASLVTLLGALKLRKSGKTIIDCMDSLKLLRKNSLAISMLREYLEVVLAPNYKFSIVVPGSEIPKWFMYQNEGSSITVIRPSYLYNMNKVVGYAVCCVFHVPKHSTGIPHRFLSYQNPTQMLICSMDGSNVGHLIEFTEKFGHRGSDHLWLLFLPRQKCYMDNWHFESNHVKLSFMDEREKHGLAGSGTGLKVKRCGFHPVYMHEVEEFDETTKQWTRFTSYNLNEVDHDFVGSNMAVANASGSGCCDDYDEEPQPNRFRQLE